MSTTLDLTVHYDFICPWCLIGKRHLTAALAQFRKLYPTVAINIDWRPQSLLPDTPAEGLPYQAFYERRLGSPAAVAARREEVRRAAADAGLTLAFEKIEVMPNTAAAHRLVDAARRLGDETRLATLIDRIFCAYFIDGRDIGDGRVLLAVATASGYSADAIAAASDYAEGMAAAQPAGVAGPPVAGVPCVVLNRRLAIPGAQPAAVLLAAMLQTQQPAAAMTQNAA